MQEFTYYNVVLLPSQFDDRSILLLFSNSISSNECVMYVVQIALNSVMVALDSIMEWQKFA